MLTGASNWRKPRSAKSCRVLVVARNAHRPEELLGDFDLPGLMLLGDAVETAKLAAGIGLAGENAVGAGGWRQALRP